MELRITQWGLRQKVHCLITDDTWNMMYQTAECEECAHSFHLIMKKALDRWWSPTPDGAPHISHTEIVWTHEPVGAAVASLTAEIPALTCVDYKAVSEGLDVLGPFHLASTEMSAEKHVSGSKVIPLIRTSLVVYHLLFHIIIVLSIPL